MLLLRKIKNRYRMLGKLRVIVRNLRIMLIMEHLDLCAHLQHPL